jgi:hypothetical protein
MANKTGLSGSTHWHNSVRTRMYCNKITNKTGNEDDGTDDGLRELIVMKNNYGPANARVSIKWDKGIFVPAGSASSIERIAAESRVDEIFLRCLAIQIAAKRFVSPNRSSTYAPAIFERMREAEGLKAPAFVASMERLISARKIRMGMHGTGKHARSHIEVATGDAAA